MDNENNKDDNIFIECSPIEGDNVDIVEPKAIYSIKPLIDTETLGKNKTIFLILFLCVIFIGIFYLLFVFSTSYKGGPNFDRMESFEILKRITIIFCILSIVGSSLYLSSKYIDFKSIKGEDDKDTKKKQRETRKFFDEKILGLSLLSLFWGLGYLFSLSWIFYTDDEKYFKNGLIDFIVSRIKVVSYYGKLCFMLIAIFLILCVLSLLFIFVLIFITKISSTQYVGYGQVSWWLLYSLFITPAISIIYIIFNSNIVDESNSKNITHISEYKPRDSGAAALWWFSGFTGIVTLFQVLLLTGLI